jgi:hypothetical protein
MDGGAGWVGSAGAESSRGPDRYPIAWRARLDSGLGEAATIRYERHEPEKTLLHHVVRDDLEPFLERSRSGGAPVARFVEREIRS